MALSRNGLDERQRIIGAKGKRPVLRNLGKAAFEHFRRTREVIDLVGVNRRKSSPPRKAAPDALRERLRRSPTTTR